MNAMNNNNAVIVGLCAGRHSLPVSDYVFDTEVNPTDLTAMRRVAARKLEVLFEGHFESRMVNAGGMGDEVMYVTTTPLVVYATGLTAALLTVINVAVEMGIYDVTVMHYDRDTGEYFPQRISTGVYLH